MAQTAFQILAHWMQEVYRKQAAKLVAVEVDLLGLGLPSLHWPRPDIGFDGQKLEETVPAAE